MRATTVVILKVSCIELSDKRIDSHPNFFQIPMGTFKTVGIFGNYETDAVTSVAKEIVAVFSQRNVRCVEYRTPITKVEQPVGIDNKDLDLVIAIGGDGTFMHVARLRAGYPAPLLGINLGRRGFLTDVATEEVREAMQRLLDGRFTTENRFLIEASVVFECGNEQRRQCSALNDIVVHQNNHGRPLDFEISINDEFICDLRADGIIVATPTGATAYALSAGGPIISPDLAAIELVPVSPHTLTQRPVIINDSSVIEIKPINYTDGNASLIADGQLQSELADGDVILIRRSHLSVNFARIEGHTFFNALRQKLSWGV